MQEPDNSDDPNGVVEFWNEVSGSVLLLMWLPADGDHRTCVEEAADVLFESEEVEHFADLEDEDGDDVEGSTRSRSFAAFTYEEGRDDFTAHIECRMLWEGQPNLLVMHYLEGHDYEAYTEASEAREDLLVGLEIPDDQPAGAGEETGAGTECPPRFYPCDGACCTDSQFCCDTGRGYRSCTYASFLCVD